MPQGGSLLASPLGQSISANEIRGFFQSPVFQLRRLEQIPAHLAVVGILGAALYSPVFTSAISDLRDFTLALACFVLLMAWNAPPWVVVIVAAVGGVGLAVLA